jgi:hypothetical protein
MTIGKVNAAQPDNFLMKIFNARLAFIHDIIRNDPSQKKFEKGWINRLNDYL